MYVGHIFNLGYECLNVSTYQISFYETLTYLLIHSFILKTELPIQKRSEYLSDVCLSLLLYLAALSITTSVQKYLVRSVHKEGVYHSLKTALL